MEKDKLPKTFKTKWLKALRSGKYIQGESKLCKKEGKEIQYCCLGVACSLVGISDKTLIKSEAGYISSASNQNLPIRCINKTPKLLRSESGIPEKLALMNDDGKSFKVIANWISKNL